MPSIERVTVTLPGSMVRHIARFEHNRSKFIVEAVQHELVRRRKEELQRSLQNPHAETGQLPEVGFDAWALSLPDDDVTDLVDIKGGTGVKWAQNSGWKRLAK